MQSFTYIKNLQISPKKLRFLLPEIKRLKPSEALDYLLYTPKRGAKFYYKAIKSALNNAKNVLKVQENLLKFKLLTIEEGRKLKRYNPGGRGTIKPYVKRSAHIKIILEAEKAEETITKRKEIKQRKQILNDKQSIKKGKKAL